MDDNATCRELIGNGATRHPAARLHLSHEQARKGVASDIWIE
jgi:hypothetical protein